MQCNLVKLRAICWVTGEHACDELPGWERQGGRQRIVSLFNTAIRLLEVIGLKWRFALEQCVPARKRVNISQINLGHHSFSINFLLVKHNGVMKCASQFWSALDSICTTGQCSHCTGVCGRVKVKEDLHNATQGPDVRLPAMALFIQHLWRKVIWGSADCLAPVAHWLQFGSQPEISDLQLHCVTHKQVP